MTAPVPLLVVAAMDLVTRQSFASGLLLDLPGAVVVSHDVDDLAGGGFRRVVADRGGVRYDDRCRLDHACLACAVREDLVPTVRQLVEDGRWHQVVVALPVSADPHPVVAMLHQAVRHGDCGAAQLVGVVSLVDPTTVVDDLFGDDLLVERGLALGPTDRRAVGEALARQLESADQLATAERPTGVAAALLDHLSDGWEPAASWNDLDGVWLMGHRLDWPTFHARIDPRRVSPRSSASGSGVWTLDLRSSRAFHPDRLQECLEDLGRGAFRARGRFWLPTRPDTVAVWDGAGGQLSIGSAGSWGPGRPSTRLVVTGIEAADRCRLQQVFDHVLLTPAEQASARSWAGRADAFGPWLDEYSSAA